MSFIVVASSPLWAKRSRATSMSFCRVLAIDIFPGKKILADKKAHIRFLCAKLGLFSEKIVQGERIKCTLMPNRSLSYPKIVQGERIKCTLMPNRSLSYTKIVQGERIKFTFMPNRSLSYPKIVQGERIKCTLMPNRSLSYLKIVQGERQNLLRPLPLLRRKFISHLQSLRQCGVKI